MNHTAKGIDRDYSKAIEYYEAAIEKGSAWGFYYFGFLYEFGNGTERDLKRALACYRIAADNGIEDAKNRADNVLAQIAIESEQENKQENKQENEQKNEQENVQVNRQENANEPKIENESSATDQQDALSELESAAQDAISSLNDTFEELMGGQKAP